jgi:predicted nuclease of predicted toxin-antitoxin system
MTPPRLYLDEDVDPLLARVLTDRGFDILTTQDARRIASSDADQLAFAAKQGRTIITHNAAHFATLARMYARSGIEHHGIVISDQLPFKEFLARTLRLLDRYSAESLRNHLIWLQDFR